MKRTCIHHPSQNSRPSLLLLLFRSLNSDTWDRGVPVQESFCWQNMHLWILHAPLPRSAIWMPFLPFYHGSWVLRMRKKTTQCWVRWTVGSFSLQVGQTFGKTQCFLREPYLETLGKPFFKIRFAFACTEKNIDWDPPPPLLGGSSRFLTA